jgi:hypothetical protein
MAASTSSGLAVDLDGIMADEALLESDIVVVVCGVVYAWGRNLNLRLKYPLEDFSTIWS